MQPVLHADCVVYLPISFYDCTEKVYFGGATKTFQKLIKLLSSGSSQNAASVTTSDIRDSITAILKGHPALLKDFTSFFPDAAPAKRNEEDYEEMDLTEYDEDTVIDMFEEMEVPEVDVTIATPDCKCTCHSDEKKPKAYKLCAMHCVNCRVTVLQNRLHIHAGPRKGLRPAYYRYLDPLPSQLKKEEDDDTTDPHSTSNDEGITLGTDTKELAPPLSLPSQPVVAPWTRAEDEILLKTLKTEAMESGESFSLNDKTVTQLASQLQNRETNEIKQRLETLLQLLSQDVDEETSHSGL
ncbi:hypothetical protein EB796_013900 [Bugula neritina]|uniref:Uncharacterized protein n=1 Tax=Bugula neritina TaxID=10212 RepID=A0A7J7JP33_BUGNE|nr:hypothetical protein EB796_013900 [Bugula neritina]